MGNEAIWAERVAEWASSGLTSKAFAEGRGFTAGGLRHWAHRLRREAAEARPKRSVRLARVLRTAAPEACVGSRAMVPAERSAVDDGVETPVVLELGGTRVAVRRGFDRATLAGVLEVVAAVARGGA